MDRVVEDTASSTGEETTTVDVNHNGELFPIELRRVNVHIQALLRANDSMGEQILLNAVTSFHDALDGRSVEPLEWNRWSEPQWAHRMLSVRNTLEVVISTTIREGVTDATKFALVNRHHGTILRRPKLQKIPLDEVSGHAENQPRHGKNKLEHAAVDVGPFKVIKTAIC